jgi:hypothetical protein
VKPADAREAARPLATIRIDNLLRSAVIESVFDLATERFESILERATRLRRARVNVDSLWVTADALYGLVGRELSYNAVGMVGRSQMKLPVPPYVP